MTRAMGRPAPADHGMAALVMPLVATTLLVCTATAALPAPLAGERDPRSVAAPPGAAEAALVVARSGSGHWFLNQQPIAESALAQLLRDGEGEVRLVTSNALSVSEVVQALAWLRRQGEGSRPVVLEPALQP